MYKGQRYTVACSVLGVPAAKDASYQAANRWWEAKKSEIDAAARPVPRPPLPMEELLRAWVPQNIYADHREARTYAGYPTREQLEEIADLHRRAGVPCEVRPPTEGEPSEEEKRRVLAEANELAAFEFFQRHILGNEPLPPGLAEKLPPGLRPQVQAAVSTLRGEPAPADKAVEAHAERWLQKLQAKVNAGRMTAARCANNRTCLVALKNYLGPQSDVTGIDAQTLEGFYLHCLSQIAARRQDKAGKQGWSVAYARDVFAVARAFIRWLWESGTIELPKNIDSRSFDFGSNGQAVQTWAVEEFQKIVTAAPGKLKLAILLMANCGMTQADVSDLLDSEVDWASGRITRKRSKTKGEANVPTVCYLLWPVTFDLLKKYRSGRERVLLTEGGEPYVRTRLNDKGRLVKADGFASNYAHVQRRLGLYRPLKQLRKLGASLLSSHKDYGRFVSYFLGHSPRTVADRHYEKPPQALFNQAVTWLGKQLGQA
jgi:integrase